MIDIPFWVRRVRHANRVSSNFKSTKFIGAFFTVLVFSTLCATGVSASDIAPQKVVDLANADRKEKGLGLLNENDKLANAAAMKAEDMVAKDYFAHTSSEGLTPWHWIEKENYDYNYAGENLAMDFVSADKMNRAWLESPTHRANIMNEKYKDIGVAVKEGSVNGHVTTVVVQMFGSGDKRSSARATENNILKKKELSGGKKFPVLPINDRENADKSPIVSDPVITSPQKEEKISGRKVEIFGRARPGQKVKLFNKDKFMADASVSQDGWFKTEISGLEEGEHNLKAKSANILGETTETERPDSGVVFFVDESKPEIAHKLLAGISDHEIILEVAADEKDVMFEIGGKKIYSGNGKYVCVLNKKEKLSVSVKVEDPAGNKIFREVSLSGYYQRRNSFDPIEEFAAALMPNEVFSAESGLEAFRNNTGIVPRQIQLSLASK